MSQGIRRPHQAVDMDEVARLFPPPPEYYESAWYDDAETIERKQLSRLRNRLIQGAQTPFHAERWHKAGFDPRAATNLGVLDDIPVYDVDDLRASIERHPPWGDYQAVTPELALREPMRVFMSGGTTGASRPTFYTQWDREVGAILMARALYMQGLRPGDTVLNSWSYGMHNGAFGFDEALYRWLNCVVLTTSTGSVTSSEKQVRLAIEYGATAILTTGDYLLRLAEVAETMGVAPTDLPIRALPNIGDRAVLENTFGIEVFDSYGIHEVQWVAVECTAHDGLHIFEDAFIVQIVDPDTGAPLPDGETGSIVLTELYKTGSAQIRYNTMDLSYLHPRERCACGSWLRRIGRFAGRGDNMVKLRGINVWPEAVGAILVEDDDVAGDWFVRAVRHENRDDLIAMVTTTLGTPDRQAFVERLESVLQQRLGVKVAVEAVDPGELDPFTEVDRSPKLKRFRDDR